MHTVSFYLCRYIRIDLMARPVQLYIYLLMDVDVVYHSIRIVPYSPESTINLVPHTDTETERSADKPR